MDPTISEVEMFRAVSNKEKVDVGKLQHLVSTPMANQDRISQTSQADWQQQIDEDEEFDRPPSNQEPEEVDCAGNQEPFEINQSDEEEYVPQQPPDSLSVSEKPKPSYCDFENMKSSGNLEAEKRLLLAEYKLLKTQNPQVVRAVDLDESSEYEEIQLVLLQARNSIEVKQGAEMLLDGLKIAVIGIEWLAPRVTKDFIRLDGWSSEVAKDVSSQRYDMVMSAIYRRYWRSYDIMNSPLSQLGLMLTTSAGMYAYKNRNGPAAPPPPQANFPQPNFEESFNSAPQPTNPFSSQQRMPREGMAKMSKPSPPPGAPRPPQNVQIDAAGLLGGLDFNQMAAMANLARSMA